MKTSPGWDKDWGGVPLLAPESGLDVSSGSYVRTEQQDVGAQQDAGCKPHLGVSDNKHSKLSKQLGRPYERQKSGPTQIPEMTQLCSCLQCDEHILWSALSDRSKREYCASC